MKSKQRLLWADSLKGWLMLLVIVGHAIQGVLGEDCNENHVWNLIYSFHMPTFMALSGWLAFRPATRNGGGKSPLSRRFRQLMVPYFAWSLILFLKKGNYTLDYLLKMMTHPDTYFWFLWVLFFIFVLFARAQWLAARLETDELAVILPLCVVLMGIMVGLNVRLFGFQFLAYYFMFYTLGYAVHRFPRLQVESPVGLLLLTAAWAVLAWWWSMHALPAWVPVLPHIPVALVQYAYRGLTAVVAIVVVLGAAPRLLNGTGLPNMAMARLGQVSLGLYVVHLTIMEFVVSLLQHVWPQAATTVLTALAAITALILSWAMGEWLQKNKYTSRILLGKV